MKIGIMGFGVVGGGVGEIVTTNAESLKRRSGDAIEIKRILDLRDFPDSEFRCFTKDFQDILHDDEIQIVCEVMGGTKPVSYTHLDVYKRQQRHLSYWLER